ncbi:hypothetical protein [Streptomyces sp. NK15101]|uniref:hypothetical protein n=1 Tax=Streptomyces sp. NK15101 TaxID=2873261 RepID=UPI001CEC2971|nr:hypothetical protein [Streptomyces sp. NK15101]
MAGRRRAIARFLTMSLTAGLLGGAAAGTAAPALRTGSHVIDVSTTAAGRLVVLVDGARVIDVPLALPKNVLVGFSAGKGGLTDRHAATGVRIGY